ncbi:MAG: TMEM143 family protein [Planctomycetota bacterium]|nr:TMEM143 family protein [Planctomycetota bacterium]
MHAHPQLKLADLEVEEQPAVAAQPLGETGASLTITAAPKARRENFIPIRVAQLVELLSERAELSQHESRQFAEFCRLITVTYHHAFHEELEQLKSAYAAVDPDSDTVSLNEPTAEELEVSSNQFFDRTMWLLERANFRRLSPTEIQEAVKSIGELGLRIELNFEVFARLEVYVRGDISQRRWKRSWKQWLRRVPTDIPAYERLAMVFRLQDHERLGAEANPRVIHLKLFKNVPKMDLEMLLPGAIIRMSLLDRIKIFVPTVSGLAISGWKLLQGALTLAATGVYGMLGLAGMLGGTVGYGVKSFIGYQRTIQKYQLNLTKRLYFQNLDNNAGVLFRLINEAEEQECREAILAYYFLRWRTDGVAKPSTSCELDRTIEQFIRSQIGCDVDFEVSDALQKLQRLGLVDYHTAGSKTAGTWQAVSLDVAITRLSQRWSTAFESAKAA